MIRRRHAMAAFAGCAAPWSTSARQAGLTLLPAPQAFAQVAVGGPTGVLAVSRGGALFALSPVGGQALLLADGIDPETPVAVGHGRIAARRLDGALWVGEGGRTATSRPEALAPAAGLLVLPLAVIGIEAAGEHHRVVRLEPDGGGAWRRVARSGIAVLPDARPLLADLEGVGEAGQVVVLTHPDAHRYRHGVLGDAVEATRISFLERHDLTVLREHALDPSHVFEDIAPRRVRLGSRDGLLTVQAGPLGAQLVLVDADPDAAASLRVAARGRELGTVNRWLSPVTDGRHWLAVHTPHLGGVLHAYRREGKQLHAVALQAGVSNHAITSRQLDLSAWQGQRLLIPDQSHQRVLLLDGQSGWRIVRDWPTPARVIATASLGAAAGVAILLQDGTVGLLRPLS